MARFEGVLKSVAELEQVALYTTLIWKNCQPYLKDLIAKLPYMEQLYSGRKRRGKHFIERSVRKNRRSSDTHDEIQDDFDRVFFWEHGWKARSNSVFCSGSISDAESYGTVFQIYPQGKYRVAYNEDVGDLFIHLSSRVTGSGVGKSYRINPLKAQFFRENGGEDYGRHGTNEFEQYYEEETKEAGDHGHWNYEDGDDVEINIPSKYKTESDATRFIKTQLDDPKDFDKFGMVWYPEMTYARFYSQFFDDWKLKREAKIWTISDEKYEEWMRDLVSDYEFDLKGAIISNNEVMVNCNKYYGIDARVHGWSIDNYIKKFGVKGHQSDEELTEWWRKDMKKS